MSQFSLTQQKMKHIRESGAMDGFGVPTAGVDSEISKQRYKAITIYMCRRYCVCGKKKNAGWSLCNWCWLALDSGSRERVKAMYTVGFVLFLEERMRSQNLPAATSEVKPESESPKA